MRLLKILALIMVVALVVAGVASAKVRDGMASVADTAEDVLSAVTDPSPSATPSTDESTSPSPSPSAEPSTEPSAEAAPADDAGYANHGAAVSEVARDKSAVATWINPAGKQITNHGQAVRLVAQSDAGKNGDAAGDGDAEASGAGNGKKDK